MKILQVNNVYGEKSTGELTRLLHEGLLERGHRSLVVYGRGPGKKGDGIIRLCPDWYGKLNNLLSRLTGMMYGGCLLSTLRLQRLILKEKPDVVHLQCINGYFVNIYRLIGWLKRKKIKTVVSLHAEFMYTANCGHAFDCDQWKHGCQKCPDKKKATKSLFFDNTGRSWRAMKKAFRGFEENCVICPVSPWTEQRARRSDILKNFPFVTVLNGLDTGIFYRGVQQPEEKTVFHATARFSPEKDHPKGGWHILELAKRMPDVRFLVAGSGESVPDCPENLTLLGRVRNREALAEHYRRAWVSVVVSRRETFSMPCAESLCCGTPVVGYEAGAPEQIALEAYSSFVPQGDLDGLEKMLRQWLAAAPDRRSVADAARAVYSADTMVEAFAEVYAAARK